MRHADEVAFSATTKDLKDFTLGFHGDNSLRYFPSLLDFPLVNTSLLSTKTDY